MAIFQARLIVDHDWKIGKKTTDTAEMGEK